MYVAMFCYLELHTKVSFLPSDCYYRGDLLELLSGADRWMKALTSKIHSRNGQIIDEVRTYTERVCVD